MCVSKRAGRSRLETDMKLFLARSRPRSAFKNLLGNANHLIITTLVGLDGVERGVVQAVPEDLRAAWSPIDPVSSAKRSRRLLLDMALIRAIDAIDVYLREAVRKPTLVHAERLRRDLDAAGLSIFAKLQAVEKHCPSVDLLPLALIFLMVAWRNRSAHSEADRDAAQHHVDILKARSQELSERFRGLDADMLLGGYDAMRSPTFKEVASLINAAHHFVADLDVHLLSNVDVDRFMKDVVWASLGSSKRPGELIEEARKRRAVSVWGKDPVDRAAAVLKFLNQQGFSLVEPKDGANLVAPSDLIERLQAMTPKDLLQWSHPAEQRTGVPQELRCSATEPSQCKISKLV